MPIRSTMKGDRFSSAHTWRKYWFVTEINYSTCWIFGADGTRGWNRSPHTGGTCLYTPTTTYDYLFSYSEYMYLKVMCKSARHGQRPWKSFFCRYTWDDSCWRWCHCRHCSCLTGLNPIRASALYLPSGFTQDKCTAPQCDLLYYFTLSKHHMILLIRGMG